MSLEKRNIAQEILDSIRSIKAGHGKHFYRETSDVTSVRHDLALSQSMFANLLGVSIRTLQEWEQHRRQPSGPAKKLLEIARFHPEVLLNG